MGNGRIISLMERDNFFLKTAHILQVLLNKGVRTEKADMSIIMDAFMKGKSKIMKRMELVRITTLIKDMNTMESGIMMFHMEEENKSF